MRTLCILIFALSCLCAFSDNGFVTKERQQLAHFKNDPLAVKALDPVYALYPDSSLVDFSYLLKPPAGRDGFVQVGDDGHFYFKDTGKRARFWGVTITQEHVDIPKDRIEQVVEVLARAGVNLVRFHSLDNRAGEQYGLVRRSIIDEGYPHQNDSQHFNRDYWDRVDYWIAQCKQRGIYVYLVLRAFRTFREGDGLENAAALDRAARPYCFFYPRLQELEKQYAQEFLFKHRNPYTGLSYAEDPAIALVEIFNEDSLFMRPERWQKMPEPYFSYFKKLWNDWLRKKYGSTEGLKKAWTNKQGASALQENERLEDGTVGLPDMKIEGMIGAQQVAISHPTRSPLRRREATEFALELQRDYFKEMRDFLRKQGLQVPLTGVVNTLVGCDTWSVAQELDFVAGNAYFEHPHFEPGKAWVGQPYYQNKNYLKEWQEWSLMPYICRYRWQGKPLVVREWATCWPNQYRAASILEMAAYGAYQDLDGLIYFAYYTTANFGRLSDFNITSDPARWLLFGLGARIFLEGHVKPAQQAVGILYGWDDLLNYVSYLQLLHRISWLMRVENAFYEGALPGGFDAFLASGRSHNSDYTRAERTFIFSQAMLHQSKEKVNENTHLVNKTGYRLHLAPGNRIRTQDVEIQGYEPIFVSKTGEFTMGFFDPKRKNMVLGDVVGANQDTIWTEQLLFLERLLERPGIYKEIENGLWISDTGKLRRDVNQGSLLIDTERLQVVQGQFELDKLYETSLLRVKTPNEFAVFALVSLDNKPLQTSKRLLLKMVTVAKNHGEQLDPTENPVMKGFYTLENKGGEPVQCLGESSDEPTVVYFKGAKLLEAFMKRGWWELVVDLEKGEFYLASDGRNIKYHLFPPGVENPRFTLRRYDYEVPPTDLGEVGTEVTYPAFAKYLELRVPID